MRTTNISPEFNYNNVNGTLSMIEKKSFMGSKLLKISNTINIDSNNIIYYQMINNEQLNIDIESTLNPIVYDISSDKLSNSSLLLDDSQTTTEKLSNTRWILNINTKTLLINYLFAICKKYRTFEGIQNTMVISNDINNSIKDYIINNILNRYQFDHIDIFISYNDLNTNSLLKFKNNWDQKAENQDNLINTFSKTINSDNLSIKFNQSKSSNEFSFNYYYNLYFTKI